MVTGQVRPKAHKIVSFFIYVELEIRWTQLLFPKISPGSSREQIKRAKKLEQNGNKVRIKF
jgi:hypothetical protein